MQSFERSHEPLAGHKLFVQRVALYIGLSFSIIGVSLLIGVLGYHFTEHLSWLDALLNASMILGGMGPIDTLHTVAGKLFASFYALFSGMVLLVAVGVLIAPVFHRFLHSFHVAPEDVAQAEEEDAAERKQ
jgi:hypothetical protein